MPSGQVPKVPEGLRDLMKGLTREILREKPTDLYEFSAKFFESLVREHKDFKVKEFEPITEYDFMKSRGEKNSFPTALIYSIIPVGLTELIKDFIKAVLRQQPQNICIFGVEYFRRMQKLKNNEHIDYLTFERGKENISFTPYVKCTCGGLKQISTSYNYNNNNDKCVVNHEQCVTHGKLALTNGSNGELMGRKKQKESSNLNFDERTIKAVYVIQKFCRRFIIKKRANATQNGLKLQEKVEQHLNKDNNGSYINGYEGASTAPKLQHTKKKSSISQQSVQENENVGQNYHDDSSTGAGKFEIPLNGLETAKTLMNGHINGHHEHGNEETEKHGAVNMTREVITNSSTKAKEQARKPSREIFANVHDENLKKDNKSQEVLKAKEHDVPKEQVTEEDIKNEKNLRYIQANGAEIFDVKSEQENSVEKQMTENFRAKDTDITETKSDDLILKNSETKTEQQNLDVQKKSLENLREVRDDSPVKKNADLVNEEQKQATKDDLEAADISDKFKIISKAVDEVQENEATETAIMLSESLKDSKNSMDEEIANENKSEEDRKPKEDQAAEIKQVSEEKLMKENIVDAGEAETTDLNKEFEKVQKDTEAKNETSKTSEEKNFDKVEASSENQANKDRSDAANETIENTANVDAVEPKNITTTETKERQKRSIESELETKDIDKEKKIVKGENDKDDNEIQNEGEELKLTENEVQSTESKKGANMEELNSTFDKTDQEVQLTESAAKLTEQKASTEETTNLHKTLASKTLANVQENKSEIANEVEITDKVKEDEIKIEKTFSKESADELPKPTADEFEEIKAKQTSPDKTTHSSNVLEDESTKERISSTENEEVKNSEKLATSEIAESSASVQSELTESQQTKDVSSGLKLDKTTNSSNVLEEVKNSEKLATSEIAESSANVQSELTESQQTKDVSCGTQHITERANAGRIIASLASLEKSISLETEKQARLERKSVEQDVEILASAKEIENQVASNAKLAENEFQEETKTNNISKEETDNPIMIEEDPSKIQSSEAIEKLAENSQNNKSKENSFNETKSVSEEHELKDRSVASNEVNNDSSANIEHDVSAVTNTEEIEFNKNESKDLLEASTNAEALTVSNKTDTEKISGAGNGKQTDTTIKEQEEVDEANKDNAKKESSNLSDEKENKEKAKKIEEQKLLSLLSDDPDGQKYNAKTETEDLRENTTNDQGQAVLVANVTQDKAQSETNIPTMADETAQNIEKEITEEHKNNKEVEEQENKAEINTGESSSNKSTSHDSHDAPNVDEKTILEKENQNEVNQNKTQETRKAQTETADVKSAEPALQTNPQNNESNNELKQAAETPTEIIEAEAVKDIENKVPDDKDANEKNSSENKVLDRDGADKLKEEENNFGKANEAGDDNKGNKSGVEKDVEITHEEGLNKRNLASNTDSVETNTQKKDVQDNEKGGKMAEIQVKDFNKTNNELQERQHIILKDESKDDNVEKAISPQLSAEKVVQEVTENLEKNDKRSEKLDQNITEIIAENGNKQDSPTAAMPSEESVHKEVTAASEHLSDEQMKDQEKEIKQGSDESKLKESNEINTDTTVEDTKEKDLITEKSFENKNGKEEEENEKILSNKNDVEGTSKSSESIEEAEENVASAKGKREVIESNLNKTSSDNAEQNSKDINARSIDENIEDKRADKNTNLNLKTEDLKPEQGNLQQSELIKSSENQSADFLKDADSTVTEKVNQVTGVQAEHVIEKQLEQVEESAEKLLKSLNEDEKAASLKETKLENVEKSEEPARTEELKDLDQHTVITGVTETIDAHNKTLTKVEKNNDSKKAEDTPIDTAENNSNQIAVIGNQNAPKIKQSSKESIHKSKSNESFMKEATNIKDKAKPHSVDEEKSHEKINQRQTEKKQEKQPTKPPQNKSKDKVKPEANALIASNDVGDVAENAPAKKTQRICQTEAENLKNEYQEQKYFKYPIAEIYLKSFQIPPNNDEVEKKEEDDETKPKAAALKASAENKNYISSSTSETEISESLNQDNFERDSLEVTSSKETDIEEYSLEVERLKRQHENAAKLTTAQTEKNFERNSLENSSSKDENGLEAARITIQQEQSKSSTTKSERMPTYLFGMNTADTETTKAPQEPTQKIKKAIAFVIPFETTNKVVLKDYRTTEETLKIEKISEEKLSDHLSAANDEHTDDTQDDVEVISVEENRLHTIFEQNEAESPREEKDVDEVAQELRNRVGLANKNETVVPAADQQLELPQTIAESAQHSEEPEQKTILEHSELNDSLSILSDDCSNESSTLTTSKDFDEAVLSDENYNFRDDLEYASKTLNNQHATGSADNTPKGGIYEINSESLKTALQNELTSDGLVERVDELSSKVNSMTKHTEESTTENKEQNSNGIKKDKENLQKSTNEAKVELISDESHGITTNKDISEIVTKQKDDEQASDAPKPFIDENDNIEVEALSLRKIIQSAKNSLTENEISKKLRNDHKEENRDDEVGVEVESLNEAIQRPLEEADNKSVDFIDDQGQLLDIGSPIVSRKVIAIEDITGNEQEEDQTQSNDNFKPNIAEKEYKNDGIEVESESLKRIIHSIKNPDEEMEEKSVSLENDQEQKQAFENALASRKIIGSDYVTETGQAKDLAQSSIVETAINNNYEIIKRESSSEDAKASVNILENNDQSTEKILMAESSAGENVLGEGHINAKSEKIVKRSIAPNSEPRENEINALQNSQTEQDKAAVLIADKQQKIDVRKATESFINSQKLYSGAAYQNIKQKSIETSLTEATSTKIAENYESVATSGDIETEKESLQHVNNNINLIDRPLELSTKVNEDSKAIESLIQETSNNINTEDIAFEKESLIKLLKDGKTGEALAFLANENKLGQEGHSLDSNVVEKQKDSSTIVEKSLSEEGTPKVIPTVNDLIKKEGSAVRKSVEQNIDLALNESLKLEDRTENNREIATTSNTDTVVINEVEKDASLEILQDDKSEKSIAEPKNDKMQVEVNESTQSENDFVNEAVKPKLELGKSISKEEDQTQSNDHLKPNIAEKEDKNDGMEVEAESLKRIIHSIKSPDEEMEEKSVSLENDQEQKQAFENALASRKIIGSDYVTETGQAKDLAQSSIVETEINNNYEIIKRESSSEDAKAAVNILENNDQSTDKSLMAESSAGVNELGEGHINAESEKLVKRSITPNSEPRVNEINALRNSQTEQDKAAVLIADKQQKIDVRKATESFINSQKLYSGAAYQNIKQKSIETSSTEATSTEIAENYESVATSEDVETEKESLQHANNNINLKERPLELSTKVNEDSAAIESLIQETSNNINTEDIAFEKESLINLLKDGKTDEASGFLANENKLGEEGHSLDSNVVEKQKDSLTIVEKSLSEEGTPKVIPAVNDLIKEEGSAVIKSVEQNIDLALNESFKLEDRTENNREIATTSNTDTVVINEVEKDVSLEILQDDKSEKSIAEPKNDNMQVEVNESTQSENAFENEAAKPKLELGKSTSKDIDGIIFEGTSESQNRTESAEDSIKTKELESRKTLVETLPSDSENLIEIEQTTESLTDKPEQPKEELEDAKSKYYNVNETKIQEVSTGAPYNIKSEEIQFSKDADNEEVNDKPKNEEETYVEENTNDEKKSKGPMTTIKESLQKVGGSMLSSAANILNSAKSENHNDFKTNETNQLKDHNETEREQEIVSDFDEDLSSRSKRDTLTERMPEMAASQTNAHDDVRVASAGLFGEQFEQAVDQANDSISERLDTSHSPLSMDSRYSDNSSADLITVVERMQAAPTPPQHSPSTESDIEETDADLEHKRVDAAKNDDKVNWFVGEELIVSENNAPQLKSLDLINTLEPHQEQNFEKAPTVNPVKIGNETNDELQLSKEKEIQLEKISNELTTQAKTVSAEKKSQRTNSTSSLEEYIKSIRGSENHENESEKYKQETNQLVSEALNAETAKPKDVKHLVKSKTKSEAEAQQNEPEESQNTTQEAGLDSDNQQKIDVLEATKSFINSQKFYFGTATENEKQKSIESKNMANWENTAEKETATTLSETATAKPETLATTTAAKIESGNEKTETAAGEPKAPNTATHDNRNKILLTHKFLQTEIVYNSLSVYEEVVEELCIKKSVSQTTINDDEEAAETKEQSNDSDQDVVIGIGGLQKTEELVEKMQKRRSVELDAAPHIKQKSFEQASFDDPVIQTMESLVSSRESSGGDTDEVVIVSNLKQQESFEYEPKAALKRLHTIAGEDPRSLLKSVTIDETVKYIELTTESEATPTSNGSLCLDDDTSENIRKKMMAYSLSEADSDLFEPREDSFEMPPPTDFDINTALEDTESTSTETESTIVSAATKIQAGARGFLTRRRLRRHDDTKSQFRDSTKDSFGNNAISESLETMVENAAAKKIQKAYRSHRQHVENSNKSAKNFTHENSLAAKRLTLQRGDALRTNSSPEDDESNAGKATKNEIESSISDEAKVADETAEEEKVVKVQSESSSTSKKISSNKSKSNEQKWLALRQHSMPVQIDCEVFRIIPKHMRKRNTSAEATKKRGRRLQYD